MRVLLIEDTPRLAEAVAEILRKSGYGADIAHIGADGLAMALTGAYDALLLDIMLPDMSGMDVLRELRESGSVVPVILLTARQGVGDRVAGLDAGADDYLVKPFAVAELLARLNALVRRQGSYMEENVEYKGFVLNSGDYTISYGGSKVQLRPREFKLIELLLRNAGKIIPRDVILERVWGIESDITENNLDVHIGALRRKLKEIKGETLIKTIRGVGYLAEADDNVR